LNRTPHSVHGGGSAAQNRGSSTPAGGGWGQHTRRFRGVSVLLAGAPLTGYLQPHAPQSRVSRLATYTEEAAQRKKCGSSAPAGGGWGPHTISRCSESERAPRGRPSHGELYRRAHLKVESVASLRTRRRQRSAETWLQRACGRRVGSAHKHGHPSHSVLLTGAPLTAEFAGERTSKSGRLPPYGHEGGGIFSLFPFAP